ncbi:uncharacterized protein LOC129001964 [Macrosteles quadrilineatus]|uniref:uncharacterized protein LOC129001964 n=1 Tax=Macrosteles quadrilineatus TaxID=74068 RepID=UPI0023E28C66|nr:uncharacterized protein LOC129001964 [Macrosteles quadrilineatus]
MSFSRSQNTHEHGYFLGDDPLRRVWRYKDLGIITTPTLHPGEHIQQICHKSSSTLGFLFRFTRGLSINALVLLFRALVRPTLEYNSPVWAPYQTGLISSLERVQVRFIRVLGCRMGYRYLDAPMNLIRSQFNLCCLEDRRKISDALFLMKIVSGNIDCPELLGGIPFHVPVRTRSKDTFERRHYNTVYLQRSTIPRLLRVGNEVGAVLDFHRSSVAAFRSNLCRLFSVNNL